MITILTLWLAALPLAVIAIARFERTVHAAELRASGRDFSSHEDRL